MAPSIEQIVGRIHSVETFGAVDGPGIRYVLFLQGCPLRCQYCHNPDTWRYEEGIQRTAREVVDDILRYRNFIATGGVTLSGGEPLHQAALCRAVMDLCHQEGISCAVDTSGAIPLRACRQAVAAADLILLDIKALDPALCLTLTGQDNRNAIELLNHCELTGKEVWIRHVLVPGLTLDNAKLEALAGFISAYSCVSLIELLPFHKMGEYKWEALRLRSPLWQTQPPAPDEVEKAKEIFRSRGLKVR